MEEFDTVEALRRQSKGEYCGARSCRGDKVRVLEETPEGDIVAIKFFPGGGREVAIYMREHLRNLSFVALPQLGELWSDEVEDFWFVFQPKHTMALKMIATDGTVMDDLREVIHGENGWERVLANVPGAIPNKIHSRRGAV